MHDPELLTQERKAAANIIRYSSPAAGTGAASTPCRRRASGSQALELPVRVSPPCPSGPDPVEARTLPAAPSTSTPANACAIPCGGTSDIGLSTPD